MDSTYITPLLAYLHTLSAEVVSLYLFAACLLSILFLFRLFSLNGLIAYSVIATIAGNIQVLKIAQFGLLPEPVALGTVTFGTLFFVSDMITEHYGKEAAQRTVWLCFFSQILMMILMLLTLGHDPLPHDNAHAAMEVLFLPAPRLVTASLIAFVTSLFLEIAIFNGLKKMTQGKYLWLRTSISTIVATFMDNILFSLLAWVILSPTPVSFYTLVFTYILGSYIARLIIALIGTPLLYLSYWVKKEVD